MAEGKVYLVGAGPGDPELLTIKGLRCVRQADVILYDGLANPDLLEEAPEGCEVIDVGKHIDGHRRDRDRQQAKIDATMLEKARAGLNVVRLKGGDPFVFGRGGEEAEALQSAGVPFEVVPGITSAIAAPAYAGIPVTHRTLSPYVTFVTGHRASLEGAQDVDWEGLARLGGTLVVLMGVRNRAEVAARLMAGGYAADTPVAVVQRGTLPSQKTVRTALEGLGGVDVTNPAAIVVGQVAGLDFSWFESRPLFGVRVAVTRTRKQAGELVGLLQALGAEVLEAPTVRIEGPADWGPVDRAIGEIEAYDWVVFSSANGVERFFGRMLDLEGDLRALKGVRIAAVGPATAEKIAAYYLGVDLCPSHHVAEGLVEAFKQEGGVAGKRILIPRAEQAREVLPGALREMGGDVREVVVYRTVRPGAFPAGVVSRLVRGELDLVTFTSSSTAGHFADLLGPHRLERVRARIPAASIGPSTSQTARDLGFRVVAEPPEGDISIPGLVRAILAYYQDQIQV